MVRLGTSGYSFRDWVGPFYPRGTRPGGMLAYYARHFDTVEINATYYRIPSAQTFERMACVTPGDFRFVVKAPKSFTHERSRMADDAVEFHRAIEPLRAAGKLSGVLLQFPYGFRYGGPSLEHLRRVRDVLSGERAFVEFRHASWDRDETYARCADLELGYCAVDEPELPGLMSPVARITARDGYVRFHGRNAGTWWGDRPGDRYDHRYTRAELDRWVSKIRALDERTETTYVFFNNCHEGQAVEGARLLEDLLSLRTGAP